MPQICQCCQSTNPRDAVYCYRDGVLLAHNGSGDVPADGSAMNIGARPFGVPLVLASGHVCHNFVQLAQMCRDEPAGVEMLLRDGRLENFLAERGRIDLAQAAHAAAHNHDRQRGLDEFLGRLPVATARPQLITEPSQIDLGTLHVGQDQRFFITLTNKGERLLYGSASADVPWLAVSDGPRASKLFQFTAKQSLAVRVVGKHLRAMDRPQEGQITLDSNGGTITLTVRVSVPVTPFAEGVLAGALSPRQLAQKAKQSPKEAALLIERGAVARWYLANGWTYPVTGPTAHGLAAVQQLFEALGLVKPPHIELSEDAIQLTGSPGQKVEHVLTAHTHENRSVVAHGKCDEDWLKVGATIFRGRSAFMPLAVASVPDRPGQTLHATITVTANGNQRFQVPVALAVTGSRPAAAPAPHTAPVATVTPPPPLAATPAPVATFAPPATAAPPVQSARPTSLLLVLLPALLLLLTLFAAAARDFLAPAESHKQAQAAVLDATPRLEIRFHDEKKNDELEKLWLPDPEPTMRFGLVMLRNGQPIGTGVNVVRLTFDPWGRTNNTCLRLDGGDERLFGGPQGTWLQREAKGWRDDKGRAHDGVSSVWACDDKKIKVTQFVELVRGQQSGLLDTCRVHYRIENLPDGLERRIGIRFLLDTFIGANDGVPFTIPGDPALCDTKKDLPSEAADHKIPDFLQALERPDLAHPGTIAHLRLKLHKLETPARVTLGAWPNERLRVLDRQAAGPSTLWNVPLLPMKALDLNDSAIAIYWSEEPLKPGQKRDVGFEYGLWNLARQGNRLAAAIDGAFRPEGELTLIAYVNRAAADPAEKLTLKLPDGFKLLAGAPTQDVPALPQGTQAGNVPVTWRIQAGAIGKYELTVSSSAGQEQTLPVEISEAIF